MDKVYLFQSKNHLLPHDDEPAESHRLARQAFQSEYVRKYMGIPLYMKVEMAYESHGETVHARILGYDGYTFIVDQNPLHQYESGIYFVMSKTKMARITWLDNKFADKYPEGRNYTDIIDTYTSWDTIHELYMKKEDITNKNAKHTLQVLI